MYINEIKPSNVFNVYIQINKNPKSNTFPLKMDPETDPKLRESTEDTDTSENNHNNYK